MKRRNLSIASLSCKYDAKIGFSLFIKQLVFPTALGGNRDKPIVEIVKFDSVEEMNRITLADNQKRCAFFQHFEFDQEAILGEVSTSINF